MSRLSCTQCGKTRAEDGFVPKELMVCSGRFPDRHDMGSNELMLVSMGEMTLLQDNFPCQWLVL